MNKKRVIIPIAGIVLSASLATLVSNLSVEYITNGRNVVGAYAISDGYTMQIDEYASANLSYLPFEQKFSINNYNDDPISFKYKRASSANNIFARLAGGGDGGFIYNEYIDNSKNFNGLDGIDKITITFTSENGSLKLYYGMSDAYSGFRDVVSGEEISFSDIYPSHIKILNDSGAGSDNDVLIESISIHYHSYNFYTDFNPDFENVIGTQAEQNIAPGSTYTVNVDSTKQDVGDKNYAHFAFSTNQNIKGVINYTNSSSSTNGSETFFLEKNTSSFNMFLDAFRNSAVAKYNKKITSISFTNVGSSNASFTLTNFGMNNRSYYRGDSYYISDEMIEVGVSLRLGGSISSIKNISNATNYNIQEYVTSSGEIKIRSADKRTESIKNVITDHPNLTNTFDLGREVQQSYYFGVDSSNGYSRGTYNSASRDYNPVQAGDNTRNESQIVDYELTRDGSGNITQIWVKVKACDWALSNSVTNSYMENTYSVNNGLINVNNRFIDWSGFTNYPFNDSYSPRYISNSEAIENGWNGKNTTFGYLGKQTVELPAFYVVHPLNYYSSFVDDRLIFDNNQGWDSGTEEQAHVNTDSLAVEAGTYNGTKYYKSAKTAGNYHYSTRNHPEDWLGYFNEDFFGVALYMPATTFNRDGNYRHVFSSGNYKTSHSATEKYNRAYLDENYNLQYANYGKQSIFSSKFYNLELESYLTDNTNYLSTILGFYPHEYVALNWSYAIGADYLNNLRTKFASMKTNEDIINDFSVWSGAEI